jgi:hypothetical protein
MTAGNSDSTQFPRTPNGRDLARVPSVDVPTNTEEASTVLQYFDFLPASLKAAMRITFCWICGKAVTLEQCKVDEHGLAVHEECYVARVALERHRAAQAPIASMPQPRAS